MSISEAFVLGGWGMYPTLVAGLATLALAARYAIRPRRRTVLLAAATGLLTAVTGALGFVTGIIATAVHIGTEGDPRLVIVGVGESAHNLALALLLLALALLGIIAGAARGPRRGAQEDLIAANGNVGH